MSTIERSTARFITILLIIILVGTGVQAAEKTITGKVTAVDPKKNSVTVDDIELDVSRKTKIVIDGSKAGIEDIESGRTAKVVYDDKLEAAISISIGKQSSKKAVAESEDREVSLFDGKTLKGWHGDKSHWKVKNGVIVGTNTSQAKAGIYLTTDEKYKDFKLRLKFRLIEGNSGVQIRSKELSNSSVIGPQADIFDHKFLGCLTGEGMTPGMIQKTSDEIRQQLKKAVDLDEWNEMTILAEGENVVITINDIETVNVESDDIPVKGVIALQLHPAGRTTVEFKDIFISTIDSE